MTFEDALTEWRDALHYVHRRGSPGATITEAYLRLVAQAGPESPAAEAVAAADFRGSSDLFTPRSLQALFAPYVRGALRAAYLPTDGSYIQTLRRFIRYCNDNDILFKSRQLSFGSPIAGGLNAGNGNLFRCTVDKYGHPLECIQTEPKQARVVRDENSGARRHREGFVFEGVSRDISPWLRTGSGMRIGPVEAVDSQSVRILQNPSFEDNGAASDNTTPSTVTQLLGFTLSSTAAFRFRSHPNYVFRGFAGSQFVTLWGLEQVLPGSFEQALAQTNPAFAYDTDRPYFLGLRWKRLASATGTISLSLGVETVTVNVASGTNGEWNHLYIPLDEGAYYRQFGATGDFKITVSIPDLAVGSVVFDDLVHAPMTNVDGTFYLPVGGNAAWLNGDVFDWEDEEGEEALFSYYLWVSLQVPELQALGAWLPTTPSDTAAFPETF